MPTITKGLGQISIIDLTDGYTVSLDQTAGSFQSDDTYTAIDLTTQFSVNITVLQGGTVMSGVKIGSCIIKDRNGTQITDGSITALATGGVSPIIIQVHGGNHAHPFTGEMATVTIPVYVEGDPLTPAPSTDVIINKIFTISASVMGESGRSSYTHIKYAEDNQGTNMNSQPSSTRPYIGINISESSTPSVIPGDYAPWTKYLGEDGQPGINVQSTTYYYLLIPSTASAPPKPTTSPPETYTTEGYSGWSETEPIYVSGDTKKLYVTVRTIYTGGTFEYSQPSLSSSYEAAKQAYIESQNAINLTNDLKQFFWNLTSDYSSDVPSGTYITVVPQSTFKTNPANSGANIIIQATTGLTLRDGITPKAQVNQNGLIVVKGGVRTPSNQYAPGTDNGLYISTDNYADAVYGHNNGTIPLDGYQKQNWRAIIGSKFAVDSEGNLYANSANITGAITATSFTIDSGSGSSSTTYDGIAAINISGYNIQIVENSTGVSDVSEGTNLYPYMFHNGVDISNNMIETEDETIDTNKTYYSQSGNDYIVTIPVSNPKTEGLYEKEINPYDYLWYQDDDTIGTHGDSVDGSYYATYGHRYRVIYDFDDGAVGGGTVVQTREVDPAKYITKISDTGITIHPEDTTNNNYIQLDENGLNIYKNNTSVAEVDWNGNQKIQGSLTLGEGTSDEVTITAAQLSELLALI